MANNGAVKRAAVRPRKKTAAASAVGKSTPKPNPAPQQNPWDGLLDTGDKVEIAATMEFKDAHGRAYWPKASVTVTKRPGESEDQTVARASQVAHGALEAHVTEFLGH